MEVCRVMKLHSREIYWLTDFIARTLHLQLQVNEVNELTLTCPLFQECFLH